MTRSDETMALLTRLSFVADLDEDTLADLATRARQSHVPAGQLLVGAGTECPPPFFIAEGQAEVTLRDAPIETLNPGDFVDEVSLRKLASWARVTAVTPMRLVLLPDDAMELLGGRSR
jgi:CRP-like cAMP-binding protein